MSQVKENVHLNFVTEKFELTEGEKGSWLKIGGLALKEGISRNNNKYTFENLMENDGKQFKWLFGHPPSKGVEEHIIGKGKLFVENNELLHKGRIRNTAKHPDVVESVKDGFLGPSIHAIAKKITKQEGNYLVEGLDVLGVGLVAFQGVKSASIDYAVAESFDVMESQEEDVENNEVKKMAEEEKKIVEKPSEPEAPAPKEQEAPAQEELKVLREEIECLKLARKNELVESIVSVNKDLNKTDLLKENDERLKLVLEYETKLAAKMESAAVVEETSTEAVEEFGVAKDGSCTMTKESYAKFNSELRERIR